MIDVKYKLKGHECFDVNPEFVQDLERVTNKLFNVSVLFSGSNTCDEEFQLMHGKFENDSVAPEAPWVNARFRSGQNNGGFQGILLKPERGSEYDMALLDKTPEVMRGILTEKYKSEKLWDFCMDNVRGEAVTQMTLDRGMDFDTIEVSLSNGAGMKCLYNPESFVCFEICEDTGHGLKITPYILEDVDPSTYAMSESECFKEGEEVIHNDGLYGAKVRPLLADSKVSYNEPSHKSGEIIEAEVGDQYTIIFKTDSTERAQCLHDLFKSVFENKPDTLSKSEIESITDYLGGDISEGDFPKFLVHMDGGNESDFYGLKLTTLSKGCLETQDDLKDFIDGSINAIKPDYVSNMELI